MAIDYYRIIKPFIKRPKANCPTAPTWGWSGGLLLAIGGLAALTLLPIGWQLNRFVVWLYYDALAVWAWPIRLSLADLEIGLNLVMIIPIGFLAKQAFPRVSWWQIGVLTAATSGTIELAQLLLPLGREASWSDFLANTAGGFIGAGLARWLKPRLSR